MNTKVSDVRIEHASIEKSFKNHLSIDGNKRILFSAPFGTGKSTFLNEILKKESSGYIYLSLYPINYSVAENQDVFELIKYDLLIELINQYADRLKLTKEDFSLFLSGQMFIINKLTPTTIIRSIISIAEKTGKPAAKLLEVIPDNIEEFEKYRKDIEKDEGQMISSYIESFKKNKGSSKEMDGISLLIYELINRLKNSDTDVVRESVLIIDDLDRLDPEHTFRLFNVFSSHYDLNDANKFGFDKVIFVCDIENIRKIFHHRYGEGVDFKGYIDKFYSKEVFEFDNRKFVKEKIEDIIYSIPFPSKGNREEYDANRGSSFYICLEWIVSSLIENKELNLRTIIQTNEFFLPQYQFNIRSFSRPLRADNYRILTLFNILKRFFSTYNIVDLKLKNLANLLDGKYTPDSDKYNEYNFKTIQHYIVTFCLPFLLPEDEVFGRKNIDLNTEAFFNYSPKVFFHYKYDYRNDFIVPYIRKITETQDRDSPEVDLNLYKILYDTFQKCYMKNIFQ